MTHRFLQIFALSAALLTSADARLWKRADGLKSFDGEFVKRDLTTVTINKDGKAFVLELSKLHADEKTWLDLNHPVTTIAGPAPAAFFDTLTFAETRDSALKKLKESKVVEMTQDDIFIGRSGLNGVFRTRQKIGKVTASLFFDWNEAGKLKELTLQSEPISAANYQTDFEPSWTGLVKLISSIYGKPSQEGPMPGMGSIPDGSFRPTHLWKLENNGSALLGTARDGTKYQLVVRFTQKKVAAVEIH